MTGARDGRLTKAITSLRQGWALAGLTILVLVSVVAASNLEAIYNSEKDFVTGSLLSLAGFCFGKALSRTHEQRALELIRAAPTSEVSDALEKEARASLHDRGVFESLTRLERDLQAGSDRIIEYYDDHCRSIAYSSGLALLRVALDDLDKAMVNTKELRANLSTDARLQTYPIDPRLRLELLHIARDFREAIARRDQAFDWYNQRIDDRHHACWDVFAVMTSDMLKGERLLSALLARSVQSPPEEYRRVIEGYVRASLTRAEEFGELMASQDIDRPKVFEVMIDDLEKTVAAIARIDLEPTALAPASSPVAHSCPVR